MNNRYGNEIQFDDDTNPEVRRLLEYAYNSGKRVRLFYGDTERKDFEDVHGRKPVPGKDWNEEYDVTGRVSASTGLKPILILVNNSRSLGGGAIMTSCVVRIVMEGIEVYRHPNYYNPLYWGKIDDPDMKGYDAIVRDEDGEVVARFKSKNAAKRWFDFMNGWRMGK